MNNIDTNNSVKDSGNTGGFIGGGSTFGACTTIGLSILSLSRLKEMASQVAEELNRAFSDSLTETASTGVAGSIAQQQAAQDTAIATILQGVEGVAGAAASFGMVGLDISAQSDANSELAPLNEQEKTLNSQIDDLKNGTTVVAEDAEETPMTIEEKQENLASELKNVTSQQKTIQDTLQSKLNRYSMINTALTGLTRSISGFGGGAAQMYGAQQTGLAVAFTSANSIASQNASTASQRTQSELDYMAGFNQTFQALLASQNRN